MASVLLFAKSNLRSSRVTLGISLIGSLLVIIPTVYQWFKKPEVYVFVKCQATSETVPSTVSCEAQVSEYDSILWTINGQVVQGFSGPQMKTEIDRPGEFTIAAEVFMRNLFQESASSSSAQLVIDEPSILIPEVIETKQPFSDVSRVPRDFEFIFPLKPGFRIVDAKLENLDTAQAYGVRVTIKGGVAVVSGSLKPQRYYSGFEMRAKPATVSGLVALVQQQEN